MPDLVELIAKLKGAEAGSRELDAFIATEFAGFRDVFEDGVLFEGRHGYYTFEGDEKNHPLPAFSTSLGAALALVEEKLPGWEWLVRSNAYAMIWTPKDWAAETDRSAECRSAANPALALLIALCRALQETARFDGDDEEGVRG